MLCFLSKEPRRRVFSASGMLLSFAIVDICERDHIERACCSGGMRDTVHIFVSLSLILSIKVLNTSIFVVYSAEKASVLAFSGTLVESVLSILDSAVRREPAVRSQ